MAATETHRSHHGAPLFGTRVSKLFASAFAAIAAWNDVRITRNALSKLTERELNDIGLTRGDIHFIGK